MPAKFEPFLFELLIYKTIKQLIIFILLVEAIKVGLPKANKEHWVRIGNHMCLNGCRFLCIGKNSEDSAH